MEIGPTASAANSASVASVKKMPVTATSHSCGQTMLDGAPVEEEPDAEHDESGDGDGENRGDGSDGAGRETGEEIVQAPGERRHQPEQC